MEENDKKELYELMYRIYNSVDSLEAALGKATFTNIIDQINVEERFSMVKADIKMLKFKLSLMGVE